jgi:hypothetical protein
LPPVGSRPVIRRAPQLDHRAGQFHPYRATPDDDEGQQPAALGLVGGDLGPREGEQQPAVDVGRILDDFEAGCDRCPLVMAEMGMRRAGGQYQHVIGDGQPVPGPHSPCRGVHARCMRHHDGDVALPAEDGTHRPSDVAWRERGGRHLVEQRLEQVVVVPVDQRDLDGGAGQRPRRLQPAEAGAQDDDAQGISGRGGWVEHGPGPATRRGSLPPAPLRGVGSARVVFSAAGRSGQVPPRLLR